MVKRDSTTHAVGSLKETPMPILFKKDFKKLPQWDFEDVYAQDSQPRQTTCPQPLQKSEDLSFKQAFIPNLYLFMHKDNLNMSEWNRLSHFNNPFGFMEYKYNEVKAAVDLIPKPKEPLLLPRGDGDGCVRCAVVGTAGILYGSGMGKEIDAHDYVFRMNGAATKGYEEDVGNKTAVYVHTAHSITASLYYFKNYGFTEIPHDEGIKYVMIPEGMRDFQWLQGLLSRQRVFSGPYYSLRPWTYYTGQFDESRFYVLHPDFLRYVRNRFLKSSVLNDVNWSVVRPTNGAFTLFLALHTCDVVDVYGFMTEDYSKYPNYYMEKRAKTHVVFYLNHDYLMEMNTWKKLHNTKIIRLYQRKDPGDSERVTEKQH
ncbi:alpha-N-acetylgalactosaminide alpha-2,6-sialyltransferase 1-like [Centroberyx gerrardi]|uniref:alpha-N-acetylgalactosaminide alpha-2,6-sialyltransferase 1-like n=1 Tax=Centroberyx gerrardi TaxID=166262 RepID=UPI003AAE1F58